MLYYSKSSSDTLQELGVTLHGLSDSEASERLALHGPNQVQVRGEPLWRKLFEPFANVFMAVLFIAAVLSFVQNHALDGIIVLAIMFISAAIFYVQKFSTERILRSLQAHNTHSVETLRDGSYVSIDALDLVPGDIIQLSEGEKIPADARILRADAARVDESLLTGESEPVNKQAERLGGDKEVYEQSNMLFQGSFVVAGDIKAVVIATGNATEFGQLAALTSSTDTHSPVQEKIDRIISQIIGVIMAVAVVAFSLALYRGMELSESIRFVLALSVSAVPESLPIAISVILVLGMRRMATKKALVRNMRAIETIGVLTTIATDKTGTLTKNKLTVQDTWQPASNRGAIVRIIADAINIGSSKTHDPLDTALHQYVSEQVKQSVRALASLPFDQSVAMSGNIRHKGKEYELVVKGAPEHILARCALSDTDHALALKALHAMTGQGYRVIALATSSLKKEIRSFSELSKHHTMTFKGFVAVADILRPEAKRAIAAAQSAGVTVRMITGDHLETAYHIGLSLGMVKHRNEVFDARKMADMSDDELTEAIKTARIFSRVTPEHKYRILQLLNITEITAMTGDGVNDVPALARAHVGVAMGSGSQIAKDAGDIVLLDNNFRSIIDAMKEGRTIFSNIRRMLVYVLSTNTGEVLIAIGALLVGLPIALVPVQILWVNLVTHSALVIPVGLEAGEKTIMSTPPKSPNAPILPRAMISRMIITALTLATVVLSLYAFFSLTHSTDYARTIAFSSLVVMQWANAFNARSDYTSLFVQLGKRNIAFFVGLGIAVSLQMLAIFGPLKDILHVSDVSITDLILTGALAFVAPIVVVEIHKYFGRRKGSID